MLKRIQPKNEQEWKNCRKQGIGSSDVGTILGLNKYESFHKWWEYRTGRIEEKTMTDAMARGHFAEDFVARYFAWKTGSEIIGNSSADIIYYNDEHPWRRATPDRFCWKPGRKHDSRNMNNKFILECKSIRGVVKDGNYPKQYYYQVMYQLGICGCDYGYIAWVDSSLEVDFERIDFDQALFDDICTAVDSAWEYNIKMDIEPSLSSMDDVVSKFNKEVSGKSVEFSNELSAKVDELKQIKEDKKELEKREEELKSEIALAMGDAEVAVDLSGVPLCTFKATQRFDPREVEKQDLELYHRYLVHQPDKFDVDAFKAEHGTKAYKSFCTSVGSRTLKCK